MVVKNILRCELLNRKDMAYETGKDPVPFGIQCIKGALTITKANVFDESYWQILEIRSTQMLLRFVMIY